jgi:hypothetical protein
MKSPSGAVARSRYRPSVSFLVALCAATALALWWMFGQQQVYTCLALPPRCDNFSPPVGPWDWLQYNPLTYIGLFVVAVLVSWAILSRRSG